ncbi:MAG: hypothetical protein EB089_08370 [Acidimicrobiia bacterium]|nr:hypothetical protein [Acidimicrobiia bacterium]
MSEKGTMLTFENNLIPGIQAVVAKPLKPFCLGGMAGTLTDKSPIDPSAFTCLPMRTREAGAGRLP